MSRAPSQHDTRRDSRRVMFVHENPDGTGGSQHSMLAEAEALAAAGWEILIVHGQPDPLASRTAVRFTAELRDPALFAIHPSRRQQQALRRLEVFLDVERPAGAHLHLWSSPMLLRFLLDRVPALATCHVPVCPNGARFHYAEERLCEHAVGGYCVSQGYRRHGCATTSDGVSFGLGAFMVSLAYSTWTLRLLAQCRAVIAPSSWQRRTLIADGLAADRVVVIPPPILKPVRPPAQTPAREIPIVLAAGRLVVLKGMHHLLQASARVDVAHEVHIVGEGPALPDLRRLAAELGIADRVRFTGAFKQDRMAAAFADAAVVVMPSLWPETFGMVGPEALLAGTPVIAYAAGGTTDWAMPVLGARAVKAGDVDGLAREIALALSSSRRVDFDQAAAVCADLSPERHLETLLDLYERTLLS